MAEITKNWIADTMKKLMIKKPIEKIRVTEICKEAEIERPTFYYHFKDKYDLMAWIFFQSSYNIDFFNIESAAKALENMKKEFIFYKRAYEDNSQTPMWQYMLEYFVDIYSQIAMKKINTSTLDTQTLYSIRLYCYGALGMTREWLLNDNITPAKTIVYMMFESMPEFLKEIFFKDS